MSYFIEFYPNMEVELESMHSKKVWEPIGCKWIYKRNKRVDKNVKIGKVGLIAKGYS